MCDSEQDWDVFTEQTDGSTLLCEHYYKSLDELVNDILSGSIMYMEKDSPDYMKTIEEREAENDGIYAVIETKYLRLLII
jgi:hypothetical protein